MLKLQFTIIVILSVILIGSTVTSFAITLQDPIDYGLSVSKQQGILFNAQGTLTCPDGTIQEGAGFPSNYFIPLKERSSLMDSTKIPLFIHQNPNAYNYYNLHVTNVQVTDDKFFINFVGATTKGHTPLCNFTDQGLTNFVMYGKCDGSEFFLEGGNGIYMNATSFVVACG